MFAGSVGRRVRSLGGSPRGMLGKMRFALLGV